MKTIVAAACAASLGAAAPAVAQTVFIDDARIHTLTGENRAAVIEKGDIIVQNGLIAAVGPELAAPDGATIIDGAGKVVTPGLIAPWSQLGLAEIGLDDEANDARPRGDFPLSAALDARDGFNPASTLIPVNRAGGVTRALVAPEQGSLMFGGRAAVFDLSGRPQSLTKAYAAQSVAMGYSGAARAGDTRLGAWALLRDALDDAKSYAANPRDYVLRRRDGDMEPRDLEALGPVVSGEVPLIVEIDRASDIRTLIALKSEYNLKVVVLGGAEAWKVARELSLAAIPVILNPMYNLPGQFEDLGATLKNAQRLQAAGVTIAFYGTASGSHNLRLLPQLAGNAVANGLPHAAALAALTYNPAAIYGLENRFGSIEIGKVADLVVWDGDPLEVTTRPLAVLIDGRTQSLDNRQQALRDRYRTLDRGALPHAYRGRQ